MIFRLTWLYEQANKNCKLLKIGFVTVHDYLFYLRQITMEMSTLGCYGMYYLAAAVSDYYIPHSKMVMNRCFLDLGFTFNLNFYICRLSTKFNRLMVP